MTEDSAMKALNTVYEAMKDLKDEERRWVLEAIKARFFSTVRSEVTMMNSAQDSSNSEKDEFLRYTTVADMFSRASYKGQKDKVLLVAAFLQITQSLNELTGRQINNQLKQLGHGVKNVTVVINRLVNSKPSLMFQVRRVGKSKQAAKRYIVTTEGLKRAKSLLR